MPEFQPVTMTMTKTTSGLKVRQGTVRWTGTETFALNGSPTSNVPLPVPRQPFVLGPVGVDPGNASFRTATLDFQDAAIATWHKKPFDKNFVLNQVMDVNLNEGVGRRDLTINLACELTLSEHLGLAALSVAHAIVACLCAPADLIKSILRPRT